MTSRAFLLATVAVVVAAPFASAQPEPPHVADLRFVTELCKRGDTALAMDYLQRLGKNPSPELAKELPFELAKTRLLIGTEEPESSKRRVLYQQARGEFEGFLAKNPDSPRAAEARLEIAHVAVLQAKTRLSKAITQDALTERVAEALKARNLFTDAGKQLETVSVELEAQLKKIPETDKARRKKLETDLLQAELSKALNLFDQAQTYLNTASDKELIERGGVIEKAAAALDKIVNKDNGTLGWQATAWLARCQQLLGSPKDARKSLGKLISMPQTPANADARRLAQYFLMLLIKESPEPTEKDPANIIIGAAHKWLAEYPRHRNTPEGYGVRYLLAENLVAEVEHLPKNAPADAKAKMFQEARAVLQQLEHSENDFTDRARRLKITVLDKQGGFKVPLEQLKTFDDCYVRSQYEIYMIGEDVKAAKELKEKEAKVKARREAAMKALELGLTKPDAKPNAQGKYSFDVNNAKLSLAFHYLNGGKNKEAIQLAEELARQDVRASQAPTAAAYAMQAYAQYLAEREPKVAAKEELQPDRDKLLAFAKFAEEAWPDELPANLARHQVGMMLLRDKQLGEAIKKLNTVTPTYPNFVQVKYQIAEACLAAEKEKLEPLKDLGSYSDIALKALLSIPDSALGSPDPLINHYFFLSRIRIGQEYFTQKKYVEMEQLATPLLTKVATVRLDNDPGKNTQLQHDITNSLYNLILFARLGQADTEFKAKRYAKVLELLNPLIADVGNDKLSPNDKLEQMKNNPQLSTSLLSMALKSTVQLNELEQTKAVLKAMQKVGSDDAAGSSNILLQLVDLIQNQIDDLKKKNDKAALDKTTKSFKHILDEIRTAQKMKTMEFSYFLAKNYSSLELHETAADLLGEVAPPTKTNMKETDEKNERLYHTVRAAYIHELRLSGAKGEAATKLKEIMVIDGKPGWGASHVDAQLEQVLLLEEDAKFAVAAKLADQWVNKLKAKAEADVQVREKYLEFYYHTSYCFYKFGVVTKEKGEKAKGDKYIKDAATQLLQLEKTWKGFGSEASTKRIQELFDKEPPLKTQFDTLKK